jgi:AraC family transcriptional regulator
MEHDEWELVRQLVGGITPEQMVHVEAYVGKNVGVFIPATGHCQYAISENHTHPSYSFSYSLEQDVGISVEGENIITGVGVIFFIPPNIKHHEISGESFVRFVSIMIDKDFFTLHASDYFISEKLQTAHGFVPSDTVRYVVRDFIIEVSEKAPGYERLIEPLEIRLVHAILRSMSGITMSNVKISDRLDIDHAVEYINSHYADQITVNDMAGSVALSPSHFSRIFKKETGMSPQEYLIDVRLARARLQLLQTDNKLTEIAFGCGFAGSAHFSSSFRKKYGMTPSRLRRSV